MIEDARTIAGAAKIPETAKSTARRVICIGNVLAVALPREPLGGRIVLPPFHERAVGSGDVLGHPAFLMLGAQLTEIPRGVNV
jgi:hypothetical protein